MKVVSALYDYMQARTGREENYLQVSASIIAQSVVPPMADNINFIDKGIRLALGSHGPRYTNVDVINEDIYVRCVRNLYYDKDFAETLLREIVLNHGKATLTYTAEF